MSAIIAGLIVAYLYGTFYFGCHVMFEIGQEEQDMPVWKLVSISFIIGALWFILVPAVLIWVACVYFSGHFEKE